MVAHVLYHTICTFKLDPIFICTLFNGPRSLDSVETATVIVARNGVVKEAMRCVPHVMINLSREPSRQSTGLTGIEEGAAL
jgi:hypothetical protein